MNKINSLLPQLIFSIGVLVCAIALAALEVVYLIPAEPHSFCLWGMLCIFALTVFIFVYVIKEIIKEMRSL